MFIYTLIGLGFAVFILFVVSLVSMLSHRMEPSATDKIQLVEFKKRVDDLEKRLK